jgi:nitroreductase
MVTLKQKMNFNQLIIARKSVRSFKEQKVSDELIGQILEAGRMAPSAVNYQPYIFIYIDNDELLSSIHQSYPREWFSKARQIIVVCANHQQSWKRPSDSKDHADIDAAIAVDHITLMAAELGIGTCWVCNFNAPVVTEALHLPAHITPIAILPIGYPAETDIQVKKRKPAAEIFFKNGLNPMI